MAIHITRNNKVRALADMWVFCDLIKYKGGTKAFSTIHEELANFVTAADRAIESDDIDAKVDVVMRALVLMPRGHLKSTICVTLYCLWRIYRNPNIRIMVGTNVKELSWAFIRELRSYLEDRELQETVWNSRPHIAGPLVPDLDRSGRRRQDENEAKDKKIIWSATALQVIRDQKMKEPTVRAGSVGSINTGEHYDLLILDDIVDFKNTKTPTLLQKTFDWAQDLESVLDPRRAVRIGKVNNTTIYDHVGDQVIVLGTRYARGDYYEYLIDNKDELGYNLLFRNIYRNGVDNREGYLWPERFNDKVIANLRKRLKGRKFASQYMNKIVTEESQPLNPENVDYYSLTVEPGVGIATVWCQDNSRHVIRPYLIVDPAISMDMNADDTSICVGGFDERGEFWVLEQVLGHFKPEKTAQLCYDLYHKWYLQSVYVENVGFQKALMYTIDDYFERKGVHVRSKEWKPHGKGTKKSRIENYLEPYFATHRIHMPLELKYNSTIQDSITYFPSEVVKDDAPDTWAILIEIAKPPVSYTPEYQAKVRRPPARAFRNSKYGGTR